jgi:hypothetical protein
MNKQKSWTVLAVFLLAAALLPHQVQAAGDSPTGQKLMADDVAADDRFGETVSLSGDTVVIVSPKDNDKGEDSGSAYVFVRAADGTWKQQAKLTAEDGAAEDEFGSRISLSGDTALIGTKHNAIYVFARAADGTWSQQAKLTPPESDSGRTSFYSSSISLSGDTALIGAREREEYDYGSYGSVYIFVRAADGTWKQQAKLIDERTKLYKEKHGEIPSWFPDFFGKSVSISGDTVLIGDLGSAYVFARAADGTWSQQAELTPADSDTHWFGKSVSISGDTAFIGARVHDNKDEAAYIFVRAGDGTWQQQAKLIPATDIPNNAHASVALSDDMAVININYENMVGTVFGSAYIFVRAGDGTWKQQDELTPPDGWKRIYGRSVAVSGNTTVIGNPMTRKPLFGNLEARSAYVYTIPSK